MNSKLVNNIRKIINLNLLRNELNEYFGCKLKEIGDEINTNILLYPPMIVDMPECISVIGDDIEVQSHMEELDPRTGVVKVGWNLFVKGTNRKNLGCTSHDSIDDIHESSYSTNALQRSCLESSIQEVIDFIIDIYQKYDDDIMELPSHDTVNTPQVYSSKLPSTGSFYDKNKSLGKQI